MSSHSHGVTPLQATVGGRGGRTVRRGAAVLAAAPHIGMRSQPGACSSAQHAARARGRRLLRCPRRATAPLHGAAPPKGGLQGYVAQAGSARPGLQHRRHDGRVLRPGGSLQCTRFVARVGAGLAGAGAGAGAGRGGWRGLGRERANRAQRGRTRNSEAAGGGPRNPGGGSAAHIQHSQGGMQHRRCRCRQASPSAPPRPARRASRTGARPPAAGASALGRERANRAQRGRTRNSEAAGGGPRNPGGGSAAHTQRSQGGHATPSLPLPPSLTVVHHLSGRVGGEATGPRGARQVGEADARGDRMGGALLRPRPPHTRAGAWPAPPPGLTRRGRCAASEATSHTLRVAPCRRTHSPGTLGLCRHVANGGGGRGGGASGATGSAGDGRARRLAAAGERLPQPGQHRPGSVPPWSAVPWPLPHSRPTCTVKMRFWCSSGPPLKNSTSVTGPSRREKGKTVAAQSPRRTSCRARSCWRYPPAKRGRGGGGGWWAGRQTGGVCVGGWVGQQGEAQSATHTAHSIWRGERCHLQHRDTKGSRRSA